MERKIINYRKYIDDVLKQENVNWCELSAEHLVQIGFFQHERLVHLMVTMVFAIMEIISIIATVVSGYIWLAALDLALMILLVPYIRHYYVLENEVQKMYNQYDLIIKKAKEL